ncbi:hypothetical protein Spb1_36150 [Planctopirus ephydatiae]|jgi:hypothetical protein|uniref:Uncharacterized protein n=1 Tax=Planctopirus ephydatiae TaxID=2528019 RepID=A0A518GSV6_9PLAN|nr:hypothetical protein Spb1_36150 [Planctopirus ephydatiae]
MVVLKVRKISQAKFYAQEEIDIFSDQPVKF